MNNQTSNKAIVLTITITVSLSLLIMEKAFAFRVMPSLNTYRKSIIPDAVERVGELKADGAWFITQNMDFTDSEYLSIFDNLGGLQASEDNPGSNKSYTDYLRIMSTPPDDSMCYNETGGLPGGTLLSDAQIDAMYASHGNRPIIAMTRSYGGPWRTETDRCLNNPKVSGICMEYVKEALLENINAPAQCINATLAKGKRVYLLLHAGAGDGWTDAENEQIIENLNSWAPAGMQSNEVILVYQHYNGTEADWLAENESVKSAIIRACDMPNYTGVGYATLIMSGAPWVGPISALDNPAEFSTLAVIPSGEYHTFVVGNAAECRVEAPPGVKTEVFVVKCYPKYLFGKWRLRPFYMPTREQHEPTGIWAVRFKATLRAGKHKIIVHTAAEDSKEHPPVEYAFKVTDVEIPPADIPFGMYYDTYRIPPEYFNDQYEDAYFRDMAEHGMNTATVYTWNNEWNMGDDDQVRHFRLMQKYGMDKFPIMLLEWMLDTPVAEIDGTKFMLYGPDEPGPQNKAECEKAYSDARKLGMPNVTALSPKSAWLFGKLFDVWIVHIDGVTPSLHQYAKKNDAELWLYNCVLRGTNPKLHRYYFGLYTWAVGAEGSFIWAYTHDRTSSLSPDGTWKATMAFEHVLPTSEGPMPTVGWEGLREGVLDYRIIRALEKRVASGSSKDENIAKASLWLARLKHSVDPQFFGDFSTGYQHRWDLVDTYDPGVDLDKIRAEAIELLSE